LTCFIAGRMTDKLNTFGHGVSNCRPEKKQDNTIFRNMDDVESGLLRGKKELDLINTPVTKVSKKGKGTPKTLTIEKEDRKGFRQVNSFEARRQAVINPTTKSKPGTIGSSAVNISLPSKGRPEIQPSLFRTITRKPDEVSVGDGEEFENTFTKKPSFISNSRRKEIGVFMVLATEKSRFKYCCNFLNLQSNGSGFPRVDLNDPNILELKFSDGTQLVIPLSSIKKVEHVGFKHLVSEDPMNRCGKQHLVHAFRLFLDSDVTTIFKANTSSFQSRIFDLIILKEDFKPVQEKLRNFVKELGEFEEYSCYVNGDIQKIIRDSIRNSSKTASSRKIIGMLTGSFPGLTTASVILRTYSSKKIQQLKPQKRPAKKYQDTDDESIEEPVKKTKRSTSSKKRLQDSSDDFTPRRVSTRQSSRSASHTDLFKPHELNDIAFWYPASNEEPHLFHPHSSITVLKSDISRTTGSVYLNDVVIDFYVRYLLYEKWSDKFNEINEQLYVFSSLFLKRILDLKRDSRRLGDLKKQENAVFDEVKHWGRRTNLFSKKVIMLPVNDAQHWSLLVLVNADQIPAWVLEHSKKVTSEPPSVVSMVDEEEDEATEAVVDVSKPVNEDFLRSLDEKQLSQESSAIDIDKSDVESPARLINCEDGVSKETSFSKPAMQESNVGDSVDSCKEEAVESDQIPTVLLDSNLEEEAVDSNETPKEQFDLKHTEADKLLSDNDEVETQESIDSESNNNSLGEEFSEDECEESGKVPDVTFQEYDQDRKPQLIFMDSLGNAHSPQKVSRYINFVKSMLNMHR